MTTSVHRRLTTLVSLITAVLLGVGLLAATAPAQALQGKEDRASVPAASSKLAARRVNFGAIALSVDTGWSGWAYDKASKKKAKKAAKKHCTKRAKNAGFTKPKCKVTLWVRNGCGAVAVRTNKQGAITKVRSAIAFQPKAAKKKAKKKIGKKGKVHTYVCTTRYR